MNDHELKEKLGQLSIPIPTEQTQERALEFARMAYKNRELNPQPEGTQRWWQLKRWSFAAGLGVASLAFIITNQMLTPYETTQQAWLKTLGTEKKVFASMNSLYPNRLNAVVSSSQGTELVLAKEKSPPPRQAVILELTEGGKSTRVITYSGKSFEVKTGGKNEKLEVMVTGNGDVIVMGEDFVWKSENPDQERPAGLEIKAKPINIEI